MVHMRLVALWKWVKGSQAGRHRGRRAAQRERERTRAKMQHAAVMQQSQQCDVRQQSEGRCCFVNTEGETDSGPESGDILERCVTPVNRMFSDKV